MATGRKPTVTIYVPSDVDNDITDAMQVVVEAMTLTLTGRSLNIEANEVILGRDMAGEQVLLRNRMLPLLAVFVLMFETMRLASLLAGDIQAGTIRALLVSSMGTRELFTVKDKEARMNINRIFILVKKNSSTARRTSSSSWHWLCPL